jgi:hypothetical protein
LAGQNQGRAIDALEAYWAQKWVGGSGALPAVAEGARALADGLARYGQAVEKAQTQIKELIAALATAAIIGIGLTILTVGISDIAAGAVAGGLVAAAAAVGVDLSIEVAGIIATAILIPTFGAIESATVDLAIQLERVYGFQDQGDINWDEVLHWAEVGAVTAPIGAAVGGGVGAAGKAMAPTWGRIGARLGVEGGDFPGWVGPFGQRLAGGTAGGLAGAASAAVGDEITTGHVSGGDVIAGAVAGFVGGAVAAPSGAALAGRPVQRQPEWTLPLEGGGALIRGRWYTEHALERMAPDTPEVRAILERRALNRATALGLRPGSPEFGAWWSLHGPDPRGIPPSVVEAEIANPGSTNVRVIVNSRGDVVTVIPRH